MFRTINKITVALVLFISILIISCNNAQKLFPQITPQEAEEVKNICDNIKPPSSFTKKDAKYYKDTESALYTIRYVSTENPVETEKYFVELFTDSGWKYEKQSVGYANELTFKKDKFTIVVTADYGSFLSSEKYPTVECLVGLF